MTDTGMLGSQQVAERLGYEDTSHVRYLVRRGYLPAIRVGRDWVFQTEDVERFVKQPPFTRRRRTPKKPAPEQQGS